MPEVSLEKASHVALLIISSGYFWASWATFAGYFVLRDFIKVHKQRKFTEKYMRYIAPEVDIILHEFRASVAAQVDKYSKQSEPVRVLEIGIGPGSSLPYFRNKPVKICALEPNPFFVGILAQKRAEYPFLLIYNGCSEDLSDFQDESFDVVVSSFVLCSVDNLETSLKEIRRVLKKGRRFYFYEHQACHKSWKLYLKQLLLTPLFLLTHDNCHPARFIYRAIADAGFDMSHVKQEYGPMSDVLKPLTRGFSIKR